MAQQTRRIGYGTVMLHALSRGRFPKGSAADQAGFLELTTTGRKSGQARTASLIYIKSDSAYVVTASNGGRDKHPGWYHNLRANPQVTVRIHNQEFSATAEVASPAQRTHLWAQLVEVAPMYTGYEKRSRREIPMVLLHPQDAADAQRAG
jgi:deazaflavin-dependent oxidoreductase (nitroreductase family)